MGLVPNSSRIHIFIDYRSSLECRARLSYWQRALSVVGTRHRKSWALGTDAINLHCCMGSGVKSIHCGSAHGDCLRVTGVPATFSQLTCVSRYAIASSRTTPRARELCNPPFLHIYFSRLLNVQHDFQPLNDHSRQRKFCSMGPTLL